MKKFQPYSGYAPDDKDLYDFFKTARPSKRNIQNYLASSGVYLSNRANQDDRYAEASDIELDWAGCIRLSEIIPDRLNNNKWTTVPFETDAPFEEVIDYVGALLSEEKNSSDAINFSGSNSSINVDVDYVENDLSQTRMFQPVPKNSQVQVIKGKDGFQIRRTVDPKGKELASKIETHIKSNLGAEKSFLKEEILISNLPTAEARLKFFYYLMDELNSLEYYDLIGVKVSNLNEDLPDSDDDTEDDDTDEAKAFESHISKADFSGKGLRSDVQINKFLNEGYYISSATWVLEANDYNWGRVEVHCGFVEEGKLEIFEYKVISVKPRNLDEYEAKRTPNAIEQKNISNALIECARKGFKKFKKE